jgi:hypothetical protein
MPVREPEPMPVRGGAAAGGAAAAAPSASDGAAGGVSGAVRAVQVRGGSETCDRHMPPDGVLGFWYPPCLVRLSGVKL